MATKPPQLVMPDGRPLVREKLDKEIAAPSQASVRTIHSGHPAQGLTPARLGSLLRQAENGDAIAYFELAEEMEEKDLHYLAVLRGLALGADDLSLADRCRVADRKVEVQLAGGGRLGRVGLGNRGARLDDGRLGLAQLCAGGAVIDGE